MSEQAAKAAENFCATINHNKQQEEDEFGKFMTKLYISRNTQEEDEFGEFMWADSLDIKAEACSIDNPECESCSG